MIPGVDKSAEWIPFRKASHSFPATCSNDHWLIGVPDVAMLVGVIVQIGSVLELKEYSNRNARNELSRLALAAMRSAFFDRKKVRCYLVSECP